MDKTIQLAGRIDSSNAHLVEKQIDDETACITLFYGESVKEEEAQALCEKLQQKYTNCEISAVCGGQPVYYYLISMQ